MLLPTPYGRCDRPRLTQFVWTQNPHVAPLQAIWATLSLNKKKKNTHLPPNAAPTPQKKLKKNKPTKNKQVKQPYHKRQPQSKTHNADISS